MMPSGKKNGLQVAFYGNTMQKIVDIEISQKRFTTQGKEGEKVVTENYLQIRN